MDLGPRLPPEVRDSPASARVGPHISTLSTSRVGVAEITARSGRPAATLVASDAHVRDAGGFSVLQPAGRSSQRDGVRGARRPCSACHGHSISSCLWRSLRSGPCPRRGEAAATTTKASSPAEVCDRPGSTGERAARVGEEGRRMEPRISSPLVLGGVPGGRLAPPKVPSPARCCPPGPNSGCWEPPLRSGRGKEASAPGNCSLPSASSSSTHVGGRHGQGHQDGVPATAPALRDEATAPPAAPTRSPTELLDAVHVPKTHLTQGAEGRSWWTDVTGRGTHTRASCSHRLPGHRSLPCPEPRAPWTAARPAREPTNAAPTRSRCLAQPPSGRALQG